jgi:TPR repeat protein
MSKSKEDVQMLADCGDDYYYGINGEKIDYEMAVHFYEKAMKKKHPHATFMLGLCHELGRYVDKDSEYAETLYEKAAEYGDANAKKRLQTGKLLEPPAPKDDDEEDEVEEAVLRAIEYIEKENYAKALPYLEIAAKGGDDWAQYQLGEFYEEGLAVEQNLASALYWYEKAAKQGGKDAKDGVKRINAAKEAVAILVQGHEAFSAGDYKKAERIFKSFVTNDDAPDNLKGEVAKTLGFMYFSGEGLPRDLGLSEKYIRMAAKLGNKEAADLLRQMK